MMTTLNAIRAHHPCANGWAKLLRFVGKTHADDELVEITTILDSNGIDDALWCLRAVKGHDREIRLYAVWCARQVQHLMTDPRSVAALDVAERFANGEATQVELDASRNAASAARCASANAAHAAARAAATAASGSCWLGRSAWSVAWDAASDAAWDAVRDAVRDAAWDAARAAEGDSAGAAAWAAARAAQANRLREVCAECAVQRAALGDDK